MSSTIVVSVDPGTVGAVAIVLHPHGSTLAEVRRSIISVVEWGRKGGNTLETGSLAGACAAMHDARGLITRYDLDQMKFGGPKREAAKVFVRCETVWVPRGDAKGPKKSPKSFLGPAMALGCFLPLASPVGFYELVTPDEWRKWHGWTWRRGEAHRDEAKALAEARAEQIMGEWGMSDHAAEALCLGLVPPPIDVANATGRSARG